MKKIIYVIGNPLLSYDNLPIRYLPELKEEFTDIEFKILDPNENIKPINKSLAIIDTVSGINEVVKISDINILKSDNIYSPHDFDLGMNLKLLYKIGLLKNINIFGVPMKIDSKEGLRQLIKLIKDSQDEL